MIARSKCGPGNKSTFKQGNEKNRTYSKKEVDTAASPFVFARYFGHIIDGCGIAVQT